jgi:hypothetical protein
MFLTALVLEKGDPFIITVLAPGDSLNDFSDDTGRSLNDFSDGSGRFPQRLQCWSRRSLTAFGMTAPFGT